jgi:hypothetical protein
VSTIIRSRSGESAASARAKIPNRQHPDSIC